MARPLALRSWIAVSPPKFLTRKYRSSLAAGAEVLPVDAHPLNTVRLTLVSQTTNLREWCSYFYDTGLAVAPMCHAEGREIASTLTKVPLHYGSFVRTECSLKIADV
jgi:hypothetical protein